MTTSEAIHDAVGRLATLKFFPRDLRVRLTIGRLMKDFVTNDAQLTWLVGRMLVLYGEWPGPRELRALYCSRFAPRDGIEARSSDYPDGYPPERQPRPPPTAARIIREPKGVTADEDFDSAVLRLAAEKAMTRRRENK